MSEGRERYVTVDVISRWDVGPVGKGVVEIWALDEMSTAERYALAADLRNVAAAIEGESS